jgi:glucose dehydrogenase
MAGNPPFKIERSLMRSTLRHAKFASLLVLIVLGTGVTGQVRDADLLKPDPNDYLLYSGTYDSQRHSQLKQITTANVGRLQAKWMFHLTGAKDLEAPPIVYKGVMYVGQYNRVHALDAATGRLIWEHFRQPASVGWQRGIGIYGDTISPDDALDT